MADWSLVVGRGGYKYFPSGYVVLECNLTGLVSCSDIIRYTCQVTFCQVMCCRLNKSLNVI